MVVPAEVESILALHAAGWSVKAIVRELGYSRNTVRRYIVAGGFVEYRNPVRPGILEGLEDWLEAQFRQHRGNAEVVRQELVSQKQVDVSLRTVERAVAVWRRELVNQGRATNRYETCPGEQAQIDFGERTVMIGGTATKVHLFVLVLGYSRRIYVEAFPDQKLASWLKGMENSFRRFGGVPRAVLTDNAKALVVSHDVHNREVVYNTAFLAFARHWNFVPKTCAPYRARTKGKVESAVGYVKHNAVAGREFASWEDLERHLAWWMDAIADRRSLQELGGTPLERFALESEALRPVADRPDFLRERELVRKVHTDLCVEIDTNHYSVPWKHIGESVSVAVRKGQVIIIHAGREIARHEQASGRGARILDARHYHGLVLPGTSRATDGELQRPLADYAAAAEVR